MKDDYDRSQSPFWNDCLSQSREGSASVSSAREKPEVAQRLPFTSYWVKEGRWPQDNSPIGRTSNVVDNSVYLDNQAFIIFSRAFLIRMKAPEVSDPFLSHHTLSHEGNRWATALIEYSQPPKETCVAEKTRYCTVYEIARGSTVDHIQTLITSRLFPSIQGDDEAGQEVNNLSKAAVRLWADCRCLFPYPKPNPFTTIGFSKNAFKDPSTAETDQISYPTCGIEGLRPDQDVYFPFLVCEVVSGEESLLVAERKNIHSTTIVLKALAKFFRVSGLTTLINRKMMIFSIAHNDTVARVFGHYPVIEGERVYYYRHHLMTSDISPEAGSNYLQIYAFIKRLYQEWSPSYMLKINQVLRSATPIRSELQSISTKRPEYEPLIPRLPKKQRISE